MHKCFSVCYNKGLVCGSRTLSIVSKIILKGNQRLSFIFYYLKKHLYDHIITLKKNTNH